MSKLNDALLAAPKATNSSAKARKLMATALSECRVLSTSPDCPFPSGMAAAMLQSSPLRAMLLTLAQEAALLGIISHAQNSWHAFTAADPMAPVLMEAINNEFDLAITGPASFEDDQDDEEYRHEQDERF